MPDPEAFLTPTTDPTALRGSLADQFAQPVFENIVLEFLAFLEDRLSKVRAVKSMDHTDVNLSPLLMLALAPAYNIFSPFEVAEYIQMSKFPHGDATSFGMRLDNRIMAVFGVGKPSEKKSNATLFSPIDNEIVM